MRQSTWFALINVAVVAALFGVGFGYREGAIAPGNALFGALSILCLFTGFQLLSRNDMPMSQALRSMAVQPSSYPSHALGYVAYVVSAALGLGIAALSASSL